MRLTIVFLFFVLPAVFLAGCAKNDTCQPKTVQSEEAEMQAFLTANGIAATQHSSGMYYQVINPGSGTTPTVYSSVSVTYVGRLLDGTVFDQSTTPTPFFPVSNFIAGWQLGLPLISEGGVIRLLIPSSLAYGCARTGSIPPHSILYFEVGLIDVQ